MLIFLLTAWLLFVVPFTVLVGRGIALGNGRDDAATDPLELPTQERAPQPALVELSV